MIAKKHTDILVKMVSSGNQVTFLLKKHGIYHIQVHDNGIYSLEDYKSSQEFRFNNPQIKLELAIFEFGKFSSVSHEAREIASQREVSPFIAEAYIVTNLAQRLLVKHYARILRAKGINVQIFDSYDSAKTWLLSFKRKS
jgi:hypothetical protein